MLDWIVLKTASKRALSNAPRMENKEFYVWVRVSSVYDGDTFTVLYSDGGRLYRRRCRCKGYDSPELRSNNEHEKQCATLARDFLKSVLPNGVFRLKVCGNDKYGRWLVDVKIRKHLCDSGRQLQDIMIESGHAQAYDGGTKKKFDT